MAHKVSLINTFRRLQGKRPIVGLSERGKRSATKHGFRRHGGDIAGRRNIRKSFR